MKALAGTSWGQDRDTLLLTYKAILRSKIDYAAPVWFPLVKKTSLNRLQCIQNSALRIITGCHKMSSWQHLHNEAKILSVGEHCRMLAAQHLAMTLQQNHPSFIAVSRPPGLRDKKPTLQSAFLDDVRPHLVDGVVPRGQLSLVRKQLHTSFVSNSIALNTPNPLLGTPPPPVHPSESSLPRACRSTLAQLRSSYCSYLKDYQHRIGNSPTPDCPDCNNNHVQDVRHLFECDANHTTLAVRDLWDNPRRVARFLSSLPSFAHLPPLLRPPQRPPPWPSP